MLHVQLDMHVPHMYDSDYTSHPEWLFNVGALQASSWLPPHGCEWPLGCSISCLHPATPVCPPPPSPPPHHRCSLFAGLRVRVGERTRTGQRPGVLSPRAVCHVTRQRRSRVRARDHGGHALSKAGDGVPQQKGSYQVSAAPNISETCLTNQLEAQQDQCVQRRLSIHRKTVITCSFIYTFVFLKCS